MCCSPSRGALRRKGPRCRAMGMLLWSGRVTCQLSFVMWASDCTDSVKMLLVITNLVVH